MSAGSWKMAFNIYEFECTRGPRASNSKSSLMRVRVRVPGKDFARLVLQASGEDFLADDSLDCAAIDTSLSSSEIAVSHIPQELNKRQFPDPTASPHVSSTCKWFSVPTSHRHASRMFLQYLITLHRSYFSPGYGGSTNIKHEINNVSVAQMNARWRRA